MHGLDILWENELSADGAFRCFLEHNPSTLRVIHEADTNLLPANFHLTLYKYNRELFRAACHSSPQRTHRKVRMENSSTIKKKIVSFEATPKAFAIHPSMSVRVYPNPHLYSCIGSAFVRNLCYPFLSPTTGCALCLYMSPVCRLFQYTSTQICTSTCSLTHLWVHKPNYTMENNFAKCCGGRIRVRYASIYISRICSIGSMTDFKLKLTLNKFVNINICWRAVILFPMGTASPP